MLKVPWLFKVVVKDGLVEFEMTGDRTKHVVHHHVAVHQIPAPIHLEHNS